MSHRSRLTTRRTASRRALRHLLGVALFAVGATMLAPAGPVGAQADETNDTSDPSGTAPADQSPVPDGADDAGDRWSVQPSSASGPGGRDWFVYQLEPGQVYGDIVGISNLSNRPIRFLLYTKDAFNVPDAGEFAAQEEQDVPTDIGTWIDLAATEVTVEPGMRADVPFSVTVPDNAEPGDHAGAILAIDADDTGLGEAADEGLAFNVRQRVGARVYVRVAGPIDPAMTVERLDVALDQPLVPFLGGGATATIDWEVRNSGNIRLNGVVELRVKGVLGRQVKTLDPVELPQLLPGGNYVGSATVEGLPPFERLTAELVVRAEEDLVVKRTTPFWSLNWLLVAIVVASLALWIWRRRRSRAPQRPDDTPPPPSRQETREEVLL